MSSMLADIDATCASLGYSDGIQYIADPDALLGLKVIIDKMIKHGIFFIGQNLLFYSLASHLDNATRR